MTTVEKLHIMEDSQHRNSISIHSYTARRNLINRHKVLVKGSENDMSVASMILRFLRRGEIHLGLGDIAWQTEKELERAGARISYTRNYNSAYARL